MTATPPNPGPPNRRQIEIELLALDLSTCTRCLGTLKNIETAVQVVEKTLQAKGVDLQVRKTLIESEEQARLHRFSSSPTVRVNGRDLVLEAVESKCDSCTDLCGCEEGTSCRVWKYRGKEYNEAPVELVVEAILDQLRDNPTLELPPYPGVPENLRQFFASRARRSAESAACCTATEQEECCEADDKEACCGTGEPSACGCR
jgi:hypothetical protein